MGFKPTTSRPRDVKSNAGAFLFHRGWRQRKNNMNKSYIWLAGALLVGSLAGVAAAAYMAKKSAAAAAATSSSTATGT